MLLRLDRATPEPLVLPHRRQAAPFTLFVGSVVAVFLIEGEKPVEDYDRAVCPQTQTHRRVGDVDGDLLEQCRGHLARDRPFPDELVEPALIGV